MTQVVAVEVGGSHVASVIVDTDDWTPRGELRRRALDPAGSAAELIDAIAGCAMRVLANNPAGSPTKDPERRWVPGVAVGVAMPGPFDYLTGIARFTGVGKFESLNGVDVRAAWAASYGLPPDRLFFGNDADAFGIGEWLIGALAGTSRLAALTLGTGIGSCFLFDGAPISSGPAVPPGGEAHLISVDGQPLEDLASGRAMRRAYANATGADRVFEVREIASRARDSDAVAASVLADYGRVLGEALGPYLQRFGAEGLVLGGSIAGAWDLIGPAFDAALAEPVPTWVSADAEWSGLVGAASFAVS